MKKRRKLLTFILPLVILTACGSSNKNTADPVTTEPTATVAPTMTVAPTDAPSPDILVSEDAQSGDSIYVDFTAGQPEGFEAANGWCNGSMFNVTWRSSNATFENGNMQLIIDHDATPANGVPYSGGEFRSTDFYGYGRYEVCMKAIKNDGVVSSFFTYTGPSDNNPWDEIDIEILGKDTTQVQFNYFSNGQGNHEYIHDLGFDASEDFHTYAFEWHEDKIVWFVDGVEVHRATVNIPVTESKIMMNAWCGTGVDGWLNAFTDENLPLTAEYQWVKFTPFA